MYATCQVKRRLHADSHVIHLPCMLPVVSYVSHRAPVPVSRQLQDVAPQGGGLIAATILFLFLAWSGIDPQSAEAVYDIPYQVITFHSELLGSCARCSAIAHHVSSIFFVRQRMAAA